MGLLLQHLANRHDRSKRLLWICNHCDIPAEHSAQKRTLKQIVKGLMFLAAEAAIILYMIESGFYNLGKLITLGDVEQQKIWNEARNIFEYVDGDRSLVILLYGIINVIFLTSAGLPRAVESTAGSTDLLITWLYKLTIDNRYYDIGAVIGILTFVSLSTVSLLTFRFSRSYKDEEGFR
ncbi:MAG: sugar ABC transporter permease [Clostridiales bacterium]|nr:sugar ABC transporter permease [Clostridiales bacterium]